MPKEIFLDASAWIALANEKDNWHDQAIAIYPRLFREYQSLVTTNLVVAESYIALRQHVGSLRAMDFLSRIRTSARVLRVLSTEELEIKAETILRQYADQDFSYADAVSFGLMEQRAITDSFTYDRHFRTMGFRMVG